jgi:hypothetical protein
VVMADAKYPAILLDCPWDPQAWSGQRQGPPPIGLLRVMSIGEIAALPVAFRECGERGLRLG